MNTEEIRKGLLEAIEIKHQEMINSVNAVCDYLNPGAQITARLPSMSFPVPTGKNTIRSKVYDCVRTEFKTIKEVAEETGLTEMKVRGVFQSVDLRNFIERNKKGVETVYRLKQTGEQNGTV